jgi:hypothetical protein
MLSPLEASLDRLLVPHLLILDSRRFEVVLLGLPGYWRDDNQLKNTLLLLRSQGEIASPDCSIFQAKIADIGLYYFILKEKTKNTNSGRPSWFCKIFELSVKFIEFTSPQSKATMKINDYGLK